MSSVSAIGSSAVQLLRNSTANTDRSSVSLQPTKLIGITNGHALEGVPFADPATSSAKSRITDALFSPSALSTTQMKLALFERTGEALGVRSADFATGSEYRAAVRTAFAELKLEDNADQIIASIEKDLGLDKMGISLNTLIDAMSNPGGKSDEALDAALAKSAVSVAEDSLNAGDSMTLHRDDLGLYSLIV